VVCALALLCASGAAAQSALPAGEPALRDVVDDAGRRLQLPAAPQRIISLAPSVTETLYALGLEERLVAVSDFCDYPPAAQRKPRVGGNLNPSLEKIVALQPDVVVVAQSANRLETVEALARLGVRVYATSPRTVEEVLASTLRLADALGARARGEALAGGLRARLESLERRLAGHAPKRVLFVVWHEPLVAVGRGSFLADALRWAGGVPAVDAEQEWPRLNLEEVARVQPDYIVFAASHSDGARRTFEELRERRGWRVLDAVRNRRVAIVSDSVQRPGPRLVDDIEDLARQLHPEAFPEQEEEDGTGSALLTEVPFSNFCFPKELA
jgi:iron complex transport system substrate-binding protein